jgi:hypothetical protein
VPPEDKKDRVPISFLCPLPIVREIDKRVSQMQADRIAKVHRSDVIKEVLAAAFGLDLKQIEGED